MFLSGAASMLSGMRRGMAGDSAKLTYDSLKKTYKEFASPQAAVFFGGSAFVNKGDFVIDDIHIELTSGFEASVAVFRIYHVYDQTASAFRYGELKAQVCMGNTLDIALGYLGVGQTVFHGFIAGLDFHYDQTSVPYIEVTGMDIKGIMMANCYAQQVVAASYGAAVQQILARTVYASLMQGMRLQLTPTPDAPGMEGGLPGAARGGAGAAASAGTIEMVSESDYEFVVKAAKRFNYEFFSDKHTIYFRPAKSDTAPQAALSVGGGILDFHIGYSVTGLVGAVETRAVDAGTGKLIKSEKKLAQDAAIDSKARALVNAAQKVYIDPSITSQQDADARASSLYEQMRYRLGSFEATCVGIPDLSPGRFLMVSGLGAPADNSFYITSVTHRLSSELGFRTELTGKAATLGGTAAARPGIGGL
ncbi:MAG: hypothetical protein MR935_03055 [Agathobaculum sp.]|uniref:phage late control D family protein n=1 Tax=Agathobaculum sp. TaxID=2048138 RepID=UPI0025BA381C|nr:hypothetical protein [Agathobaculum sp.]MCI7125171.1 hypothetical protein [Agathobaculum sp.]MDY3712484.1 hypothetical protein [Agathobaculum sp.]